MSAFKVFPLLPLAIQVGSHRTPHTRGSGGVEHFQLPLRVRESGENNQQGARLFSSRRPALVELLFSSWYTCLLWSPPTVSYVAALIPLSLT